MKKLKVGIIGCGTIGSEIAKACVRRLSDKIELISLFDIDGDKIKKLEKALGKRLGAGSLERLIKKSDLLVEAASGAVAGDILKMTILARKSVMIMSVGGLLGKESLLKKAEKNGINVYLPSGALAGIDALKAASLSKIDSVTITTKKPPKGLAGAPYLTQHGIDINNVKEETVIFEGSAEDAVSGFPQNVNVSALLALAGIGAVRTKVRVVTSPSYTKNSHEVEIKGESGTIRAETINVPSPANPKTSFLAVLSAIATLKGIVGKVKIGT